ncbi:MAG TPA: ArsR family transcriptional regulator [Methanotrichaceae archaeon]|nr:ArsR family transcriptional regulator [Methanotrichaceae archaeon]
MPGKPDDIKMVSNAMANAPRRKMMSLLANGDRTVEEIGEAVGKSMLDYHLKILEQAGLLEIKDGNASLSEFGKNFMEEKSEKGPQKAADLSKAKPVEIAEVRQLIPCIADSTKFRTIANMAPPLAGSLKHLEPLFPRGRYSGKIGALMIQRGEILITVYGSGKVTMTMIKDEDEAKKILDDLRTTINRAIESGVTPVPRERVKVDPLEIRKYLPRTDCGECGEQSCYSFAIRLMAGEVSLDLCAPLKEPKYRQNLEHLKVLAEYI